jgi:LCP family protein required for cell wall assembly
MGVDSGHDRNHALTDTLLVLSVDRVDKTAVMLSIPRDISEFKLYSGGTYHGKINSLMTAARLDPSRFPDGPIGTLTRQIGFIIGVPVDYYAQINLEGFEQMVNLVGGVDIDNPRAINDPLYDWFDGTSGFQLSAGPHHLNGRLALAYVRSRQGIGDSDFTRARRQQQVLSALRAKMTTPDGLRQLPALLDAATRTIRTDFPADHLRDYVALAKEVGDDRTQRYVLGPPYAHTPTTPGSTYILLLDRDRIAKLSVKVFGSDSAYATAAP